MIILNKEKFKVFIVGGYENQRTHYFIEDSVQTTDITKANICLFTGGEDINPEIYGETRHPTTSGINKIRDKYEITMFRVAMSLGIHKFGICRGAQLLGALSGTKLIQHQVAPNKDRYSGYGGHIMITSDGEELTTTHAHHQSINLEGFPEDSYKLLAFDPRENTCYGNSYSDVVIRDKHPEFVYFPKTSSFCYQGHPEWMSNDTYGKTIEYINKVINEIM